MNAKDLIEASSNLCVWLKKSFKGCFLKLTWASCAVLHLKKDVTFARLLGWDKGTAVNIRHHEVPLSRSTLQKCVLELLAQSLHNQPRVLIRSLLYLLSPSISKTLHLPQEEETPSEPSESGSEASSRRKKFLRRFSKTKKSLATREKLIVSI